MEGGVQAKNNPKKLDKGKGPSKDTSLLPKPLYETSSVAKSVTGVASGRTRMCVFSVRPIKPHSAVLLHRSAASFNPNVSAVMFLFILKTRLS